MGEKTTTDIEKWVWFYHNMGFSIIPIQQTDPPSENNKRPAISTWKNYQTKQPTDKEIQYWLDEGLFQNIAIVCGSVSNNLVIIDIDDATILEKLGLKVETIIERGHWVVRTGKGYHIYCKHNEKTGGTIKHDDIHIEYRADGGYTVVPPSIHPSGADYKFLYNETPDTLKPLKERDVKKIFNDMVAKLGGTLRIQWETDTEDLKKGVTAGERNDSAFRLACEYRDKKLTISETEKLIREWNKKNKPPLSDNELIATIRSAYSKQLVVKTDDTGKEVVKTKEELLKEYKVIKYKPKRGGNGYEVSGINAPRLAKLIMEQHDMHFLTTRDNKELYYFDGECYTEKGESIVRSLTQEYIGDLTTKHTKEEVLSYITDNNYVDREIFSVDENYINLKNGIYNIREKKLENHDPKYHFLNMIPIKYKKDADCPKIKKFLSEVAYAEDIPTLQEFLGYCMYRRYNIHKICMLLGEGKNGKSTFLRLLTQFLGEKNILSRELYKLITDRFAIADLHGKLGNVCGDVTDTVLKHTGLLKSIVGEDYLTGERKYKGCFSFLNYAKLIFSANKLPETQDKTLAYYRRWILISFPNTFDDKNCNPNLLEEIATEEEMSGLFNFALDGLERLMVNGDFSYNKTTEDIAEQYENLSNPIFAFTNKFIKTVVGGYIEKDEVYEKYVKWCRKKRLYVFPLSSFTRKLKETIPEIRITRIGGKGQQERVYAEIGWKTEEEINADENTDNREYTKNEGTQEYSIEEYHSDDDNDQDFFMNPNKGYRIDSVSDDET